MVENPDNPRPQQPGQTTAAALRPIRRGLLIVIGVIAAAPVVGFLSKDWCCTTIGCTVLCGIVVAVWDRFFLAPLILKGRCTRKMQFLPMLIILGILAAFFMHWHARVFERIFGVPPPPELHNLSLDSANWTPAGGGEETILMRFTADEETIKRLLQHGEFTIDAETMRRWSDQAGGDWAWLWDRAFRLFVPYGGQAWKQVEPMSDPVLYRGHRHGGRGTILLLRDRVSGRTYVVCFT